MQPKVRKTRRAWNEPGHAHFLTYSCLHRWPLLSRDRTRSWVVAALKAARRRLNLELWAYVIMPEHVHVLLRPKDDAIRIERILVALKRPIAVAARKYLQRTGQAEWLAKLTVSYPSRTVFRFWQPGGGHDNNIFHEKTVPAVINYIHANPVRRQLATEPTKWMWSSAAFWEGRTDVPLEMDQPFT